MSAIQLTGFSADPLEVCEAVKTNKRFLPGDGDQRRSGTVSSRPAGQRLLAKLVIHGGFFEEPSEGIKEQRFGGLSHNSQKQPLPKKWSMG